jgi:hypothetical protein
MTRVMDDRDVGEYPEMPDNVVESRVNGMTDYFIEGTKPAYVASGRTEVEICSDSGYRATPWCPNTKDKSYSSNGGAPRYYCNIHNSKPGKYPIDPNKKINKNFDPDDPDGSKKKEEDKKKKEEKKETQPKTTPDPEPPAQTPDPTPDPEPTPPPTQDPSTSGGAATLSVSSHMNPAYAAPSGNAASAYDDDQVMLGRYLLNYYFALKLNGGYG